MSTSAYRIAYSVEWRKRNADKVREYEHSRRKKKTAQMRAWRKKHWDVHRASQRRCRARSRAQYRQYEKARRIRERAKNPAFSTELSKAFRISRPNYHIEWRARKKLRLAWTNWTRTLAASRHP